MRRIWNVEKFRQLDPCYDPTEKLPSIWTGDIVAFFKNSNVPLIDRIWTSCRQPTLTDAQLRELGVLILQTKAVDETDLMEHLAELKPVMTIEESQKLRRDILKCESNHGSYAFRLCYPDARQSFYNLCDKLLADEQIAQEVLYSTILEYLKIHAT